MPPTSLRLELASPPLAAVLLVGCVVVVWRLYRAELRRVPRRVAGVLLALRAAAVAAVLLVVVAEPAVVRTQAEPRRGRVVVAVDVSESTRVADPERPLLDKLRLARELRLHDGVAADDTLAAWIDDVHRSGLPTFPAPDTDAGVARRGMFDEVVDRASTITRGEIAGRVRAALRPRLDALHAVEEVEFGGRSTDLKAPLALALEGDPPAAVVLLTDGRHTDGDPPRPPGVPVFPVALAPREPPVDVAVVSVTPAVATVPKGSSVAVEVRVKASRWPTGPIDVSLKLPDGEPLTRTIDHAGGDRAYDLTFHPRLTRTGPATLTATVTTAPPDRLPVNNTRAARATVSDAKPRVLLIDGEARWEHHYLHAALSRSTDPPIEVKAVLFRQPRLGDRDEAAEMPALKMPDDLSAYDSVVLGDTTAEQLSPADRERLRRFVADSGGTLVVVAGKRAMPLAFADDPAFRPLLPVRRPRVVSPSDGFRPALRADGNRAWFLRLGDTPEQSAGVWESFPPHFWGVVGEAKDGADVLATVADPNPKGEERQSALVARHHYGFGRVLFVGLDSTWRWRFKVGDEHHHRFWKQVVQWAVAGRLLPATSADGGLRFGTREAVYSVNQEVVFVVRAGEKLPRAGENAVVKLVRSPGTPAGTFALAEDRDNPREWTARFGKLPPGRYAVEPDVPEWSAQLGSHAGRRRAEFDVIATESDETTDLSGDVALLEELAAPNGGRVFDAADAGAVIDELTARSSWYDVDRRTPLRRSWWTLAVVVLLLAAEWTVRKFAGLA